jgi:predicted CopG family antitoxin
MNADSVPNDMADTSIRVSHELADELFDRKQRGESYEDVIWRLIEQVDECDVETSKEETDE